MYFFDFFENNDNVYTLIRVQLIFFFQNHQKKGGGGSVCHACYKYVFLYRGVWIGNDGIL